MATKPRKKGQTKVEKRLNARIADWSATMNDKTRPPSGIGKRIAGGGYHKPGSLQRG